MTMFEVLLVTIYVSCRQCLAFGMCVYYMEQAEVLLSFFFLFIVFLIYVLSTDCTISTFYFMVTFMSTGDYLIQDHSELHYERGIIFTWTC